MDSYIFLEDLKVGPLRFPKVLWNIIKEYMYCTECFTLKNKIIEYFTKTNKVYLRNIILIPSYGGYTPPNTHSSFSIEIIKKDAEILYIKKGKTISFSLDSFVIFLMHYFNNVENPHIDKSLYNMYVDQSHACNHSFLKQCSESCTKLNHYTSRQFLHDKDKYINNYYGNTKKDADWCDEYITTHMKLVLVHIFRNLHM